MPKTITKTVHKCSKCGAEYKKRSKATACETVHQMLHNVAEYRKKAKSWAKQADDLTESAQQLCPHPTVTFLRSEKRVPENATILVEVSICSCDSCGAEVVQ